MRTARKKATVGLVWEAGTRGGLQVLSWLSTILVARLLFPDDYGLVAISGIYTGLVTLFSGFGINAAIVNRRITTDSGYKGAFIICVVSTIVLYLGVVSVAGLISEYYERPELSRIIPLAALIVILSGLQLVPAALASVALDFKFKAIINAIGQIANLGFTLTLAMSGFGYWSLIVGVLVQEFLVLSLVWRKYPVNLSVAAQFNEVVNGLRYSLTIMSTKILSFVATVTPNFIASIVFSTSAVGLLSLSMTLAFAPVRKIGQIFNGITFATISSTISDQRGSVADIIWLLRYLCLVSFPALVGFYLVADDVIWLLLSEKWAGAVPVVKVWCLVGIFEILNQFWKAVITGSGDAKTVLNVDFAYVLVLPVALLLGTTKGLLGLVYGMLILAPVVCAVLFKKVVRCLNIGVLELLTAMWPAFVSTTAMYVVASYIIRPVLASITGARSGTGLFLLVSLCIINYALILVLLFPRVLREFRYQLKHGAT